MTHESLNRFATLLLVATWAGPLQGQDAARVRGSVIDARSRARLPGIELTIEHLESDRSEVCTTDESGRFVTKHAYPPGSMSAELEAPYFSSHWFQHALPKEGQGDPTPIVLSFEVGPEVDIEPSVPAGCNTADLLAWQLGPGEHPALEPMPASDGVPLRSRTDRHAASVRFPERLIPWEPEPDAILLGSPDGLWGATVEASAPHSTPYSIQVEARGRAEITVLPDRPLGGSEAGQAPVRLDLVPSSALPPGTRPITLYAGLPRPELVGWLVPGPWTVIATSNYLEGATQEFVVPAGGSAPVEIVLGPPRATGTIRLAIEHRHGGRVPPDAEELDPWISAWVHGTGTSSLEYHVSNRVGMCGTFMPIRFRRSERDGATVFEAEIREVPVADYRVEVRGDHRGHDPPDRIVRPGSLAEFVIRPRGFEVRAVDALTGVPVPDLTLLDLRTHRELHPDQHGHIPASETDMGDWRAMAPGYRSVYGSEYDLVSGKDGARLELELKRGWGLRLTLVDEAWQGVADVRVRFAGQDFVTPPSGDVILTAPTTPSDFKLEIEGYDLLATSDSDVAPDGSFSPDAPELFGVIRARSTER